MRAALFLALLGLFYWLDPFSSRPPVSPALVAPEQFFDELTEEEMKESRFYRMVDEAGKTIVITGRLLRKGDRYLASDNSLFEVVSVENYLARARLVERIEITLPPAPAVVSSPLIPVQAGVTRKIAIYHSHNAESYLPSDGADSIYGRGGIHDVGAAFREALEQKEITVLHSERLHLPHDRGAYRRSRTTALELLRRHPDAIFDVHRDAAPWDAYALELDGEWITQIHFVVGLSNPGASANQRYAFDLKGYADRIHPGLVKGVFLIWGSYNQDLSPVSLLLEVGAHTNSKEAAMKGITLFADAVGYYFYGPAFLDRGNAVERPGDEALPPALYRDAGGIVRAVSGTVIGLLLTSLGAALGFYFLNNPGSLEELLQWWEELPARASNRGRQGRAWVKQLPALLKQKGREFPGNLRYSWRRLGREARELPGLIASLGSGARAMARSTAGAGRRLLSEAPARLRQSWMALHRESRDLPIFFRRLAARLRNLNRRVQKRAASGWESILKNVRLSGARAKEEGAVIFNLIRERFLLLRNRLR